MTRKHYQLIADSLKTAFENSQGMHSNTFEVIAQSLARSLAQDNPRFDRGRFLVACGLGNK